MQIKEYMGSAWGVGPPHERLSLFIHPLSFYITSTKQLNQCQISVICHSHIEHRPTHTHSNNYTLCIFFKREIIEWFNVIHVDTHL